MLIQKDKKNLQKLQERYNFENLRPPPEIYQINIPQNQYFIDVGNGQRRRRIFYKVVYMSEEQQKIKQVKSLMGGQGIFENFPDELILKHLYASEMDIKKCLQRLVQVQQFHNSSIITRFQRQTIKALESGCIYTYGHDRNMRPIVIIRADKMDYNIPIQENYNAVYNLLLVVLGIRMVPYHSQKYICIFDLNDMNMSQIPYKYIFETLKAMNLYYCGNTEKSFIFNSKGIGMLWTVASKLIPEQAKKKIKFIDQSNHDQILDWIDAHQLQKKYGGKLQNLTDYWPPRCTNQEFDRLEMLRAEQASTTDFFSIQNNNSFFEQKPKGMCGSESCSCPTF